MNFRKFCILRQKSNFRVQKIILTKNLLNHYIEFWRKSYQQNTKNHFVNSWILNTKMIFATVCFARLQIKALQESQEFELPRKTFRN